MENNPTIFQNPFAKKLQALKDEAILQCCGCGADLPEVPSNTIRRWCSKPEKAKCRKLYRAKTRLRTAARYA